TREIALAPDEDREPRRDHREQRHRERTAPEVTRRRQRNRLHLAGAGGRRDHHWQLRRIAREGVTRQHLPAERITRRCLTREWITRRHLPAERITRRCLARDCLPRRRWQIRLGALRGELLALHDFAGAI